MPNAYCLSQFQRALSLKEAKKGCQSEDLESTHKILKGVIQLDFHVLIFSSLATRENLVPEWETAFTEPQCVAQDELKWSGSEWKYTDIAG